MKKRFHEKSVRSCLLQSYFFLGKKKKKREKKPKQRHSLCDKAFKVKKWEKILKCMTCIEITKPESYEDIVAR